VNGYLAGIVAVQRPDAHVLRPRPQARFERAMADAGDASFQIDARAPATAGHGGPSPERPIEGANARPAGEPGPAPAAPSTRPAAPRPDRSVMGRTVERIVTEVVEPPPSPPSPPFDMRPPPAGRVAPAPARHGGVEQPTDASRQADTQHQSGPAAEPRRRARQDRAALLAPPPAPGRRAPEIRATPSSGRVARRERAPQPSEVQPERTVHVTIGRIEVRATPPPSRRAEPSRPRGVLSLDDYLAGRRSLP
jgi:hypothetical protein